LNLAYISWNVDPEIFRIGGFAVRWYGLLFALGFFLGYLILLKVFKKEDIPVKVLDELTTYMVIGTVIGARLGHCFFYEPAYYFKYPWRILMVWEGGLASHGAAIAIVLALWLFSYKKKMSFLWVFDRVVITVALAGLLIRLGNLMNSEIFGHVTSLPWGFQFLRATDISDPMIPRHPTQLYEGFAYLVIFLYMWWYYYHKNGKPAPGYLSGMFMLLVFGARFLIEFVKEPQVRLVEDAMRMKIGMDLGQLLSIPLVIAGIALIIYSRKQR
jgi:phosphatidylglycerol---prolipoprotein diacylglyceryl transferase